jgi:hypothetical protein
MLVELLVSFFLDFSLAFGALPPLPPFGEAGGGVICRACCFSLGGIARQL